MKERFVGLSGWPTDSFAESAWAAPILAAMRKLPEAERFSESELAELAREIHDAARFGIEMSLTNNKKASRAKNERDLFALRDWCEKGIKLLEATHSEAVTSLARMGVYPTVLKKDLEGLAQEIHLALHELEDSEATKGRPKNVSAQEVTDTAARIYERVTGRSPTVTTNTADYSIGGPWPLFLSDIFQALNLEASLEDRAKKARKRPREKSGGKKTD